MNVFELEAQRVRSHTDSLRADAGALSPLTDLPIPEVSPVANYARAVRDAIACANDKAEELQEAARRIAGNMDLTVQAAYHVDESTSQCLGGAL